MEKKNNKKFRLFDFTRDGKGISKTKADLGFGLKKFFILLKENFNKLVTVNIIFVLGNFPIFFLVAALSGLTKASMFIPLSDTYQTMNGMVHAGAEMSPYMMTLYSIDGLPINQLVDTTWTYVLYGISALTLITFGPINAGTAYVLRNIVSGEPVFVWSDFIYAVKRNFRQALIFGIIDAVIIAILALDMYWMFSMGGFLTSMFFWTSVVLLLLYFFMRYYMYVQMVTFDLSILKMLKNAMIFSLAGLKRNFVALLGMLICVALEILFIFGLGGLLLPIAVAAPLALLFSLFAYMKVYAAYYKIKELMIDPYYEAHPEERPVVYDDDDDIIMHDDVTENERLEAIKKKNGIES